MPTRFKTGAPRQDDYDDDNSSIWSAFNTLRATVTDALNKIGTTSGSAATNAAKTRTAASVSGGITESDRVRWNNAATLAAGAVQTNDTRLLQRARPSFFNGMTPTVTGPDTHEYVVPYGAGGAVKTFDVRGVTFRVAASGTAAAGFTLEKYTGTGAFTAVSGWGVSVSLPAGSYETTSVQTSPYKQVQSGDKLRINITSTMTGSPTSWSVFVQLTEAAS